MDGNGCAIAVLILIGFILGLGISYLGVALLTWLVCLGFGFTYTWKLALGIWVLITWVSSILTNGAIKITSIIKNE